MITPPYHFSIIASSPTSSNSSSSVKNDTTSEILYRGSIPSTRNKSFIKRLKLKTVVVLRKKQLKDDDPFIQWSSKNGINVRWIKAEEMGEEKLGMGKNEVTEVLKIILDSKAYPIYIADLDGISHTTLIVACLRKLQGWNMDCIVNEICRFEPEYEDLPILPFIQSYLSPSSSSSSSSSSNQPDPPLALPQPPYPGFIWPPIPSSSASSNPKDPLSSGGQATKLRDRSTSTTNTNNPGTNSSSNTTSSSTIILPFPHPLVVRKHPTMKITFPILPPPPPPPQLSTATSSSQQNMATGGSGLVSPAPPLSSPTLGSTQTYTGPGGLSRVNSRREKSSLPPVVSSSGTEENLTSDKNDHNNLLGQAVHTLQSGFSNISHILGRVDNETNQDNNVASSNRDEDKKGIDPISNDTNKSLGRTVSFNSISEKQSESNSNPNNVTLSTSPRQITNPVPLPPASQQQIGQSNPSSPSKLSRQPTRTTTSSSDQYTSEGHEENKVKEQENDDDDNLDDDTQQPLNQYVSEYQDDDDEYYEDEDDEDDDEDEDDEDEDDGNEPTSQYISALDLAGFG